MIGSTFLNRYHIAAELGRGGYSVVYRGHDLLLEREVAIKILNETGIGVEGRDRLLREAQASAKLDHPNIVPVYDAGEENGIPYIVMQLVTGKTLADAKELSVDQVIEVARQLCAALEHAHSQGIIHRDIKPENVAWIDSAPGLSPHFPGDAGDKELRPEVRVKLMDFGLAHLSGVTRLTQEGMILGTVNYLAPEQALGRPMDGRADLYALGILLYELATQRLPFTADDPLAVISQHLYAPVVPPSTFNAGISPALDALILQLLSKDPDDRPASAVEVLRLLDHLDLVGDTDSNASEERIDYAISDLSLLERIARGRLVGRDRELAEVSTAWRRAAAGEGQVLLISGEPGIGKTRLVRELATRVEVSGGKVLVGECYSEGGAPYAAITQMIRLALHDKPDLGLPDLVMADLLTLTPHLQSLYPQIRANPALDPESERQRMFTSVVSLCTALAEKAPLLLFVDDAHWADSGTLDLLLQLAQRLRQWRVMIVLTYREIELDEARPFHELLLELNRKRLAVRIKLSRLSLDETRHLLASMFAEEITADFLEGIYRETEGNPFFVEEVCRALVESGKLYFADGRWHWPSMDEIEIPQSVRMAIQSRLTQLPPAVQEALYVASLLGREFEFDVLLHALEQDEDSLIQALETAERAQLVEEVRGKGKDIYTFVHALIPGTLSESLSGRRRRRIHHSIAQAIETLRPDDFNSLASHYAAADDPEKGIVYSLKAAEQAKALFVYESALGYILTALDLIDEGEQSLLRLALLEKAADLHSLLGRRSEAIPVYQEALHIWQDIQEADQWVAVRLYRKIGEAVINVPWFSERQRLAAIAHSSFEAGLQLVGERAAHVETVHLFMALSRAAWFIHSPANWDEAEYYARAAVRVAEHLSEPAELSAALGILSEVYGSRGLFRERVDISLQRLALSHDSHFSNAHERAKILQEAGRALVHVGEYRQAIPYFVEAEQLAGQIQALKNQVFALRYLAHCWFRLDHWDGVLETEQRWRSLEQRYANFIERSGPI